MSIVIMTGHPASATCIRNLRDHTHGATLHPIDRLPPGKGTGSVRLPQVYPLWWILGAGLSIHMGPYGHNACPQICLHGPAFKT